MKSLHQQRFPLRQIAALHYQVLKTSFLKIISWSFEYQEVSYPALLIEDWQSSPNRLPAQDASVLSAHSL